MEITYQDLERRIKFLNLALLEAAREKYPDGTANDAIQRAQARSRWINNAYSNEVRRMDEEKGEHK